jgi:BlaI family penicillinase repressor
VAKHQLAALQLAIMQVLWERGEATVADVREALHKARPLAHTTIGTMLAKMERNGQVRHRVEGRVNIYRAAVQREQVRKSMLADLTSRLFGGDLAEMVSHLLDSRDVSPEELARLKALIREKEQRHGK